MKLELPTTPRPRPAPSLERDTILLFGPPKSRKTSGALTFPTVLLIDCERGARKYGGLIYDVLGEAENRGDTPLNVLRGVYASLLKECLYETVVIDTLDSVSRWYEDAAVESMNKKHGRRKEDPKRPLYTNIADIDYGAGHAEHRSMVLAFVESLVRLPCMKILICHSKTMIADEVGSQVKVMDLPGKLGHYVAAMADHLGAVRVDPERGAVVEFDGYEVLNQKGFKIQQAGSRLIELNAKTVPLNFSAIMAAVKGDK